MRIDRDREHARRTRWLAAALAAWGFTLTLALHVCIRVSADQERQ